MPRYHPGLSIAVYGRICPERLGWPRVRIRDLGQIGRRSSMSRRKRAEAKPRADTSEQALVAPFGAFVDWMRTAALPLWATSGTRPDGGFYEALTLDGQPEEARRRARVQTRQIFVFCRAGALGWCGPWRERAAMGLDRFLDEYVRSDGAIRSALSLEAQVVDDGAYLYEQAFGLLALASAHEAGIATDRCEAQALTMLERLEAERPAEGGWREIGTHPYQANANMHLFEAAQSWAARGVDARWDGVVDILARAALERLIDPARGLLREFFDSNWNPASSYDGRLVEPGHQFEWSWLLSRYALRRGDDRAMTAARRLYAHGLRGIDPQRGVAIDELDDLLKVRSPRARLWPQTEWLRAALAMADQGSGDDRAQRLIEAERAMYGLAQYLRPNGTWRDKFDAAGSFIDEPAPASSLYHIMGACEQVCMAARTDLISDTPVGLN